jgi:hypothetical protein
MNNYILWDSSVLTTVSKDQVHITGINKRIKDNMALNPLAHLNALAFGRLVELYWSTQRP